MALEKTIVNLGFKLLGKALVSCSKIEVAVKKELVHYEEGFVIELKVMNTETKVAVKKAGSEFKYLSNKYTLTPDLTIVFKSYKGALLLVLGQIGLHEGYAQHRFIVQGDFTKAMPLVRMLYYVEAYLFPKFITRHILKEEPKRSSTKIKAYLGLLCSGGKSYDTEIL